MSASGTGEPLPYAHRMSESTQSTHARVPIALLFAYAAPMVPINFSLVLFMSYISNYAIDVLLVHEIKHLVDMSDRQTGSETETQESVQRDLQIESLKAEIARLKRTGMPHATAPQTSPTPAASNMHGDGLALQAARAQASRSCPPAAAHAKECKTGRTNGGRRAAGWSNGTPPASASCCEGVLCSWQVTPPWRSWRPS